MTLMNFVRYYRIIDDKSYKKKYLAEQRMHLEAEQELQSHREQISLLQKMVAQLQAKASMEGLSVDPARALHDGSLAAAVSRPSITHARPRRGARRG